jgi:hypothetical protein
VLKPCYTISRYSLLGVKGVRICGYTTDIDLLGYGLSDD